MDWVGDSGNRSVRNLSRYVFRQVFCASKGRNSTLYDTISKLNMPYEGIVPDLNDLVGAG